MAKGSEALAKDIEQIRGELKQLRDELRVRLHLGTMDARDAFATIEHEVDHVGRDISQATQGALVKAREQLKALAAAFRDNQGPGKNA